MEADAFRFLVELEVKKAVRLQYCVSLACVAPDLPGDEADPLLTAQIAKIAIGQLRATDVVAVLDPSCVGLLLVDAEPAALPGIVRRAMEPLGPGLKWSGGAGSYPRTAGSGRALFAQAMRLLTRARRDGGGRPTLFALSVCDRPCHGGQDEAVRVPGGG